ncbi:MAG: ATP-dependent Zn protease [Snowella sp.]|nr:ATP-dependent Zn protease [Snowella sp.]
MSDKTLNLTAIAIFLMMLSVLVGPFVQLSPLVPAIATVTVLGVVTWDQVGWQGRVGNLVMGLLASKEHQQRILHHEAGHFLAAYYLGIPVKGYTLSVWETFQQGKPGLGGVEFDTEDLKNRLQQQWQDVPLILERFATVWMAGIAAEQLMYGNAEGGTDDRQQLRTAFALTQLPAASYQQKERWALLQAENLLANHRPEYDALVQAMTQRLSVADCYQKIQETQVV